MSSATYCDRCGATLYASPTLYLRDYPAVKPVEERGVVFQTMNGFQAYEICEVCAVDLREWMTKR